MNTTFRRIIAMILVVSLTMTMTGCTDGAGGSVLDKLAYVVGNVIHAAVFAVGELIISGIFEGLDKLITPIEEWLGWGDWWDVQRAGVPVVIWYGRLVDPNNKFDNWDLEMEEYKAMYQNQDDSDEEEQLGGLPQTGGGESDIGFPHTGQEEPSTEPPATEAPTEEVELPETGEEEPAVQMPQTGRAEPEKKSFFGRIWDMFFGCDHVLMLNTEILEIQCDCGESCLPYTPEMTFDEFMDYVTKDVLQEEEEYEAYASREYARYRIHHSDECFHMNSDLELYGLDLKTDNKVRCVQCGDELSPMHYYFSDYLEAKYGNSNYKKLNKEKLKLALTEYVGIKGMSYDAWNRVMNQETDQNKVIQMASGVHEGIQLVDSYFQLLYQDKKMYKAMINKNDFGSFYRIDNAIYSLDMFRNVMSMVGTIDSVIAFGESCEKLEEEKRLDIANTYYIDMQNIDSGIEFAKAAGNLVGFYHSLAGGQIVPGLTLDAEAYRDIAKDFKYKEVSISIFYSLADLNIPNDEMEICLGAFWEKKENIKVQEKRWPNGPTAEQTLKYIDDLSKLPGADHPSLESWYFYLGWRMEYECANMIQMILDDKI